MRKFDLNKSIGKKIKKRVINSEKIIGLKSYRSNMKES